MAAGFVTINFLDGDGLTKTGRFWSSDGTTAGLLYPSPVLADTAGAAIDWTAPSPIMGVDGATIATVANPFPVQVQVGSNAIGSVTATGTGTAASPATGLLSIQGLQADDAALGATATNPVPVGGKYNATLPTYTDGDRTQAQFAANGALLIGGTGSAATPATAVMSIQGFVADDAAAGTTNPIAIGGRYNVTLPSYTDGDRVQAQFDVNGLLRSLSNGLAVAGSDTQSNTLMLPGRSNTPGNSGLWGMGGFLFNGSTWDRTRTITASFGVATGVAAVEMAGSTFNYISTATTTQVKSGAGILHKIIINTPVAGTISLIDNTAGSTVNIGIITMTADVKPYELTYDLGFTTGLRIITSVASDVTVVYR